MAHGLAVLLAVDDGRLVGGLMDKLCDATANPDEALRWRPVCKRQAASGKRQAAER